MGEISDVLDLYVRDEGLFEREVKEIQLLMQEQTVLHLNEGMNNYTPKGNYRRTGHTADSIRTEYKMEDDLTGIVRAYLSQDDYTKYVDQNSIWGGYHFFKGGLERTMRMYR